MTKFRVALDGLASIMVQKGKLDDADRAWAITALADILQRDLQLHHIISIQLALTILQLRCYRSASRARDNRTSRRQGQGLYVYGIVGTRRLRGRVDSPASRSL